MKYDTITKILCNSGFLSLNSKKKITNEITFDDLFLLYSNIKDSFGEEIAQKFVVIINKLYEEEVLTKENINAVLNKFAINHFSYTEIIFSGIGFNYAINSNIYIGRYKDPNIDTVYKKFKKEIEKNNTVLSK